MGEKTDKPPPKRVNILFRETDWAAAEKLRAQRGERSVSSLIRRLIREAAKEMK